MGGPEKTQYPEKGIFTFKRGAYCIKIAVDPVLPLVFGWISSSQ